MYILWKRTCQSCYTEFISIEYIELIDLFLLFTSMYYKIDIELLARFRLLLTPCIKYKFLRQVLCVGINHTTWQEHATLSAGIVLQNIIYIRAPNGISLVPGVSLIFVLLPNFSIFYCAIKQFCINCMYRPKLACTKKDCEPLIFY